MRGGRERAHHFLSACARRPSILLVRDDRLYMSHTFLEKKRSHRSSHSMLANFCTVLFMFFKATAVGSVAPRLPEAQCNWFGGRSTVASPSVKT